MSTPARRGCPTSSTARTQRAASPGSSTLSASRFLCLRRRVCADHPAGGVEPDLVSMHVLVERGTDGCDDASTRLRVRPGEDAAERAESGEVSAHVPLRKRARHVHGLEMDLRPAARFEDAFDAAPVREGELSWCIW